MAETRKLTDEQMAQIGNAIRRTRETQGMTQAALSKRVGAAPTTITAIEHGQLGLSAAAMFRYAAALQCTWEELLGPSPGRTDHDPDFRAGYRAGVGDAIAALRNLNANGGDG